MKPLRRWSGIALLAAAMTLSAPAAAVATPIGATFAGTTYIVTITADTDDGRCDTHCSLREAITAANANPGADTVRIRAGTYTISLAGPGEDANATGDLDITDPVALVGAGRQRTILDGGGIDRVLEVVAGPTTISRLAIRHGFASVGGGGGGIRVGAPSVALTDVAVTDNATVEGLTGDSVGGGLIASLLAGEINLTLTRVTVTGNRAHFGGGIAITTGGAALTHVTVSGNIATGPGGGFYNNDSLTTVTDGVIRENVAETGGAAFFNSGSVRNGLPGILRLTRVQVNGNSTPGPGGALSNADGGIATITDSSLVRNRAATGAVAFNSDTVDMVNSTLSGNVSASGGVLVNRSRDPGNLYSTAGTGSLLNVTAARNSAGIEHMALSGPEVVTNTILANRGPNCAVAADGGPITSHGGNLDSQTTCGFTATGDLSGVDPRLGGLSYGGGPTLTRPLRAGSPAIDAALDAPCPDHDQRGVPRPQGPHCDIGAYEAFPATAAN